MSLRLNLQKANPAAYQAMSVLEKYTRESSVDPVTNELIKLRASQINGCAYCLDMHAKDLMAMGNHADRILLLSVWREVPHLFSDQERAALELTEYVTNISVEGVPQPVYEKVRQYFTESEYVDLLIAINTINSWNRLAISSGLFPGCFKS
ncbi:carboxymuconolactone decarboxylase family protein [Paenibacillus woosongensis]|uniref:Carboxymuconolactone decarboxylase family protein n=1 Tax=Paenibacillus woosongensis TaxID=307580 RepID=A0A7X3CNM4_9BACL|nr:carboxymuconolactone decarboxylase family protein [Paenibacillus woosongensis]MUG46918.1 carboxymuconolactone decarboxylase family protein [Paenibacillus woosongensis]